MDKTRNLRGYPPHTHTASRHVHAAGTSLHLCKWCATGPTPLSCTVLRIYVMCHRTLLPVLCCV